MPQLTHQHPTPRIINKQHRKTTTVLQVEVEVEVYLLVEEREELYVALVVVDFNRVVQAFPLRSVQQLTQQFLVPRSHLRPKKTKQQ